MGLIRYPYILPLCISQLMLTRYYQLGGFNNVYLFSHNSRGWKSYIKVLADSSPGERSFPSLQTAVFLLCPYVTVPTCAYGEGDLVSLLLIRTPAPPITS